MKKSLSAFYFQLLTGGIFLFLFSGCKVIDPAEEIPCYIHIDKITLLNNEPSKITDAWVFVDNQLIGAFELPCTFPVLVKSGDHDILVRAGIKMNGSATTRAIYPHYKGWESTVTLTQGQSTTIQPTAEFFSGVQFLWTEDFESPGNALVAESTSPANVWKDNTDVYEGSNSGIITLNTDSAYFVGRTAQPYALSTTSDVYLEMNYKSDVTITVGVETPDHQYRPWVDVAPSAVWNKIYINLNDVVIQQPIYTSYYMYIACSKPADVSECKVHLDDMILLQ
ncbi:MAG TPA: hypothetical protein VFU15_13595 [Bacteroidia bacterium]|nr:hypothetical protein [Bacteroidia bacterium]